MGLISRVSSRTYRNTPTMVLFGTPVKEWTLQECNDKLIEYRQKKIRSSQLVKDIACRITSFSSSAWNKISDKHAALEQCVMACVDCGDQNTAVKLFRKIELDFPRDSSKR